MYSRRMETTGKSKALVLNDAQAVYKTAAPSQEMVRTQIYLTGSEHEFVMAESRRLGRPMAAVIREYIDEKMRVPDDAWVNNPLLVKPTPDPNWEGHEDGAINHDHYIYGCPKKFVKKRGKWVAAEPIDE
jgi:hypothetical protein